jgi:exonuclease VII small subunit
MADDAKNGQMNFSTDLSALNQFMKSLQKFVNQANSTEPAVQRLRSLFEELNTMILTLNTSFQAMKDSANVHRF